MSTTALVGVSALGGAVGLATGGLSLGEPATSRLPYASPVLAATALALVIAVPSGLVTYMAWHGSPHTERLVRVLGATVLVWIATELAVVRELSPLQPLVAAVGAALLLVRRRTRRRSSCTP